MKKENIEAPEEIYATKGDIPGELNLQWDAVEGATTYILQIGNNSGKRSWKHLDIVNESRYIVEGLMPDRKYGFRVASLNRHGQSSWSREILKTIN